MRTRRASAALVTGSTVGHRPGDRAAASPPRARAVVVHGRDAGARRRGRRARSVDRGRPRGVRRRRPLAEAGVHRRSSTPRPRALGGLTVLVNNAVASTSTRPTGRSPTSRPTAWDAILRVEPHRADVVRPRRDPAHAARRPRLDRQHLEPPGRAGEPRARRVHRGQVGPERPDPRDRGRLRRPTASAATRSAPATCSTTAATPTSRPSAAPRYEGMHLTRLGVADRRRATRPCTSRAARVGVRHRHQPAARRRQQHRPRRSRSAERTARCTPRRA